MFRTFPGLCLLLAVGCADPVPEPLSSPVSETGTAPAPASRFDPLVCADVQGRITWRGPVPAVPPLEHPRATPKGLVWCSFPNPHAPRVAASDLGSGLAGAVVTLRGVDPTTARPWDHPLATLAVKDGQLRVSQGSSPLVGWVRPGERVDFVTHDADFETLRATAVSPEPGLLFTLPLPLADLPLHRSLDRPGIVSVSSGSGHYWMQTYLWVVDHPYIAVTDERGRFALPRVPAGRYDAVVWHPNWHRVGHDRNPETGMVIRQHYAPPAEKVIPLEVTAGVTLELRQQMEASDFPLQSGE